MAKPAVWHIYILKKKATHLGTVEAKDEAEAKQKAAKRFGIPDEDRFRLSAQKK